MRMGCFVTVFQIGMVTFIPSSCSPSPSPSGPRDHLTQDAKQCTMKLTNTAMKWEDPFDCPTDAYW